MTSSSIRANKAVKKSRHCFDRHIPNKSTAKFFTAANLRRLHCIYQLPGINKYSTNIERMDFSKFYFVFTPTFRAVL